MSAIKKKGPRPITDSGTSNPAKDGTDVHRTGDRPEDSCRCKEVSGKTFSGMFKLMIGDLAFWKKNTGRK